jgi:hypothetical protein
MPVTVTGPDNITVSFPDGTDAAIINDVMMKHFGGGKSSPVTSDDLVRSAAHGIPIVGGAVDKFSAYMDALTQPVLRRGSSAATREERYQQNLDAENARTSKFETEHPIASTAAGIAGGTAATLPLAATSAGARLLGLSGGLGRQIGMGAASGGVINAADAMVRGNDPGVAGVVGAGIGAAAPPVARLIGGALSEPMAIARGIVDRRGEAARRVGGAITHDIQAGNAGLTQAEYNDALTQGMPVNLMDLGGDMTGAVARSAGNTSPAGRGDLNRAINDRFESQAPRTAEWFQGTLNYPTPAARDHAIRDVAENVYEPAYARAYRDSATTPLWPDRELIARHTAGMAPADAAAARGAMQGLEQLAQAPEVQQAIRNAIPLARNWAVRDGLRPPSGAFDFLPNDSGGFRTVLQDRGGASSPFPSLQLWDYVKRALDRMGTPTASTFAREIRSNLDTLVPSYERARDLAQPIKFFGGASNAFEAGQNFVAMKLNAEGRARARDVIGSMRPEEQSLFHDGYASSIADTLMRSPDRRSILNRIMATPAAREEAEAAMGPQRFRELEARLRIEGIMENARHAVQGNSTTARQLAELGLAGGGSALLGGGNPLSGDPAAIVNAAFMYGAIRGGRTLGATVDERVSREVARLLTSSNPQHGRLGMAMLTRNPNLMQALRRADVLFARAAAPQVQQLQ